MANFENITIEKGMYRTKGGLTGALEKLDPSENYVGTSLEGLDAFSRQLKRYDIRVSGRGSDCVEKFFQTSNSAALFPEYVSRAVRQGMERADILPNLVATVTDIEGMDYRSIVSAPTSDEKSLKIVNEGAQIPQTTVRTRENLVKLHKRGRMLVASYEALRFQRLDLFTVTLNQIGAYIARAQLSDAIGVLLNGDGNNNAAAVVSSATAGTLTYDDLVKLWANMAPYELNTLLAPTAEMQKILALTQMQDSRAGLDFQGTGKMITPMGAALLHAPEMTAGTIIGLDKTCALEMVQAGGVVTDYDKLIDRQLERAAITCTAGFAKIFTEASKALSV
ncbi:MAG: phage major capsid protein [Ruminococcus sp.]